MIRASAAAAELESTDEALVERARAGSREAFVGLMTRHQDRIYRLARRLCQNPADAEEVCQEAFRLAFKSMGSFRGDSHFDTWLYRIATNEAFMRLRTARTSRASLELLRPGPREADASGPSLGVDELVHQKRLTERVRSALACLDDAHRAALVLRDVEELPVDQVAEILCVSRETVRQRAHRARLKLRERLGTLV